METIIKKKGILKNIMIFLAILGPGIITGSVDNDAGGITTYSVAGALYGYKLLWTLFPAFIVLLVIQEMNARMGIVTGKGLADLIRENAGVKVTFFIFIGLLVADIGNTTTEFAGVAGSMEVFGVSKYISVPISAIAVWVLVVKGTYRFVEKIFLVFSLFLFVYVVSALMGKPHWGEIGTAIIHPEMQFNFAYIAIIIGIIGTTIAPWMQFYMQSAVIEKGLKIKDYKFVIWDVVIGSSATVIVAFFIIIACAATLYENHIPINEAKDAAMALKPLAGNLAYLLFAVGVIGTGLIAIPVLSGSISYIITETFGWEQGLDKKFHEAKAFYVIIGISLLLGLSLNYIGISPIRALIYTAILYGLTAPVIIAIILHISNNKKIMGDKVNGRTTNILGILAFLIMTAAAGILVYMQLAGK